MSSGKHSGPEWRENWRSAIIASSLRVKERRCMEERLVKLSKTISHALRHKPGDYGLRLDAEGWVPIDELLGALRRRRDAWRQISLADLERIMAESEKQRFEV